MIDRMIDYLYKNYYDKQQNKDIVPTREEMERALVNHPDKVIVVGSPIRGIAVFVLLTDETYSRLHELDITKMEILVALASENGRNMHFLLLAADSFKTIFKGLKHIIGVVNPKTVSWYEPDFSYLHKYNLN